MRLVVGLFAMFLTASVARADEANAPDPKPEAARPKVPLRVVRVLPESHQALLFDKNRGTHVLADIGGTVDGYTVEDIDDDEVTLSANGREIVLAAPAERQWNRGRSRDVAEAEPVRTARRPAAPAVEAPIAPYAEAPVRAASAAPADPYAPAEAPAPVRAASAAPADPYAPDAAAPSNPYDAAPAPAPVADPYWVAPAAAPAPAAPAKKPAAKPAKPAPSLDGFLPPGTSADDAAVKPARAPAPAPAPATSSAEAIEDAPAPAPEVPAGPVITPTVVSRSEMNAAIGDFTRLTGVLRGSFTPDGARLDLVADGSVFAKAGLRRGDIVTAVDNRPLRSIDDAADLYVRAPQTRAANVQIIRAGKPLTLRILLQ